MINVMLEHRRFLRLFLFAVMGIVGCSARVEPPVSTPRQVAAPGQVKKEVLDSKRVGEAIGGEASPMSLQELSVVEERGQTTVHVRFSKPVSQYRHFTLTHPTRIILDILGVINPMAQPENFNIATNLVGTLRLTSGGGDSMRMAIDVAAATVPPYVVESEDGGLRILIGSVNSSATAKRKETLVHEGKRVFAQLKPQEEKKYVEPEVSLVFENVDIEQVFRFLGEVGGKNIVVTEDVKKKITLNIKEPIPWDQALDLLIDTSGLGKEQVGNVIRISTLDQLTRDRNARAAAEKAKENEGAIQTAYFTVNYARVRELADKIQRIKSPAGIMVPDDQTNTILVRDIKRVIEEAKTIVSKFDVRAPQVLIESNLIETSPTFARVLGLELNLSWRALSIQTGFTADPPFQLGIPAIPTIPGTGGTQTILGTPAVPPLGLQVSGEQSRLGPFRDVSAILSAAEQEGNIKTISRPSIVTLNNVASTIESNRILRIALPSSTNIASGSGAAAGTAVATERVEVGITLRVTPQVSSDGFILLSINVRSSSLGSQSPGSVIPDELAREATANVLVRDGETIVIGGIMKDISAENQTGVPWLRDIPVLGWIFKKVRVQKDFEELMVFITPRIISAGATNRPSAEELWRHNMKKTEGDQATTPSLKP